MRFIKHLLLLFTALTFVMGVYLIRSTLAEYERRQGLYWYDVERSYDYAFDADRTTRVSVAIDATGEYRDVNSFRCHCCAEAIEIHVHPSGIPGPRLVER